MWVCTNASLAGLRTGTVVSSFFTPVATVKSCVRRSLAGSKGSGAVGESPGWAGGKREVGDVVAGAQVGRPPHRPGLGYPISAADRVLARALRACPT